MHVAVSQAHKAAGYEILNRHGLRQRRPGGRRAAAATGDGDSGGDLGGRGLDGLAAAQELPADHAANDFCAATGRFSERNIRVGQPFDRSFPASGAGAAATVQNPKNQSISVKLQPSGGFSQFRFEQTELSGYYQVKVGPPLAVESSFAANPDPAESDLTKLDRAQLAEAVPGWNFLYLINSRELTEDASSVGRRGELHRPLLYSLLAMLLLESALAWRFGHHDAS